jgi:carbon starvation protein
LALGILVVLPPLVMPPLTRFVDGTGPIFAGNVFPFCFITIACGAISGFHSLIASGTTPKLITRESYARPIGYGSMLMECAVAIMALLAACTLEPGVYFAINSPAAVVGPTPDAVVRTVSGWGFPVTTDTMTALARDLGENTMFGRAGGAPTLAVGMTHVFSAALGGKALMSLWYHFAIMFEALFILTTVDAGTRVGRFLIQAFLGQLWRPLANTRSYGANVLASALLVGGWGYFLYQGVVDPLGGINSLWPLFGIANQLLSVVALCLGTTILIKMGKSRHAWVTLLPLGWVASVTFTAAVAKIASPDPQVGFLAQASALAGQVARGGLGATKVAEIERTVFNLRVDAAVAALFLTLVGAIVLTSLWRWLGLVLGKRPLDLREAPVVWLPPEALLEPRSRGLARWLGGATVLALGIVRHLAGQSAEPREAAPACLHDDGCHRARVDDAGRAWAEQEERRFANPRCC